MSPCLPKLLRLAPLILLTTGCEYLTTSEDERRCARSNAFAPNTAQMRVGEVREFKARGFVPNGPGQCISLVKGGFRYHIDKSDVATVDQNSGLVTAHAAGTAQLTATTRSQGLEYRGTLRLTVVP